MSATQVTSLLISLADCCKGKSQLRPSVTGARAAQKDLGRRWSRLHCYLQMMSLRRMAQVKEDSELRPRTDSRTDGWTDAEVISRRQSQITDRMSERAKQLRNELDRQNKNKPSPILIGSLYLLLGSIAESRTMRSSWCTRVTSRHFRRV